MGPLNYMAKTERKSMAALEAIDFEDDSIDQFGAGQLGHLPQSQILDAYACIFIVFYLFPSSGLKK